MSIRQISSACLLLAGLLAGLPTIRAADTFAPPPIPAPEPVTKGQTQGQAGSSANSIDQYNYGVGYAVPWQPVSGKHWRKGARLEYYSNSPAPTWRWFHTGRGCPYDPGLHYGIGYPFTVGYQYPKYASKPTK